MAEQRIDEARQKNVGVAIAELDQAAVWVDPAPLLTGHPPRRRELASAKLGKVLVRGAKLGAHSSA